MPHHCSGSSRPQCLAVVLGLLFAFFLAACSGSDGLHYTGPRSEVPDATVGEPFSLTLTASGTGPHAWSVVSGALPDGLSLDADTGVVSGTPTTAGAARFTVRCTAAGESFDVELVVTVDAAPVQGDAPVVLTTQLPDGTVGTPYERTLQAAGTTPLNWSLASGTLPEGLALGATTGVLAGTPNTASSAPFTVQVTNAFGTDTQQVALTIHPQPTPPTITGPSSPLPDATLGAPYEQTFTASGTTPITWTVTDGELPVGLSLNQSSGQLAGTPTVLGAATFTVTATNAHGHDDQACVLTVATAPSLSSLQPDSAPPGVDITITGSGFDTTPANNDVRFGTTAATVQSATETELTVRVPRGITGELEVTVAVRSLTSDPRMFDVYPKTVWFVAQDAEGEDDGTSWADAFTDLATAILAADGDDEIWVASGTYVPGAEVTDAFDLEAGLEVYGGFAGGEAERAARNTTANVAVLSGENDGNPSENGGNARHVVILRGQNVLDGFAIRDGVASGDADDQHKGGGVAAYGASNAIRDCDFAECSAWGDMIVADAGGGAIFVADGPIQIVGCTFVDCSGRNGGALLLEGTPSPGNLVRNCIFVLCHADYGGAAFDAAAYGTWINCVFVSCGAQSSGSALRMTPDGVSTIRASTFYDCEGHTLITNSATISSVDASLSLNLTDCIFWGNRPNEAPEVEMEVGQATVTTCVLQFGLASVSGNPTDGGGNTTEDPLFENALDPNGADNVWGTRDDGLMPGAAGSAVDAGTLSGAPATDVTDTPRPMGAGMDIGAYEAEVVHE